MAGGKTAQRTDKDVGVQFADTGAHGAHLAGFSRQAINGDAKAEIDAQCARHVGQFGGEDEAVTGFVMRQAQPAVDLAAGVARPGSAAMQPATSSTSNATP